MATTLIVIALMLGGFVLSRSRFVKELNSRRFMPVIYMAAAIYFGARAFGAASSEARVWPHVLLAAMFLGGAVESARASGIFRKS
jgi:hypothetical protein